MKITGCRTLHCDAGWRNFSFLKLQTDDGLVGISEYNESYGSKGLTAVIEALVDAITGDDPCRHEFVSQKLYAMTRQAHGGLNQQAIAANRPALYSFNITIIGSSVNLRASSSISFNWKQTFTSNRREL